MDRRARLRSSAKWTCTGIALLLLGFTIASRWWAVLWNSRITGISQWHLEGGGGTIQVHYIRGLSGMGEGLHFFEQYEGWKWGWTEPVEYVRDAHWRCGFLYWQQPSSTGGSHQHFEISLLNPLAFAAIGAALLWRIDGRASRRERVGLCGKCGYDRHGLTARAPCPECGSPHP